jgi:putative hydrolase of the HAD superfamily
MLKAILFDFGGVLAEEGFLNGLEAIGRDHGRNPDDFFALAQELIFSTGYLLGRADEATFWEAVRKKSGIRMDDEFLRKELLDRFILREEMLQIAGALKKKGFIVAILSDQTDWLDELDRRTHFFGRFDQVFNSFHIHRSKRDPAVFTEVCSVLVCHPQEVLFIDDSPDHVKRAASRGLKTIYFQNTEQFKEDLKRFIKIDFSLER